MLVFSLWSRLNSNVSKAVQPIPLRRHLVGLFSPSFCDWTGGHFAMGQIVELRYAIEHVTGKSRTILF